MHGCRRPEEFFRASQGPVQSAFCANFLIPARLSGITAAKSGRLLRTGGLLVPEYDDLDSRALPGETQAGGVKHNRGAGAETGSLPFQEETQRPEA